MGAKAETCPKVKQKEVRLRFARRSNSPDLPNPESAAEQVASAQRDKAGLNPSCSSPLKRFSMA